MKLCSMKLCNCVVTKHATVGLFGLFIFVIVASKFNLALELLMVDLKNLFQRLLLLRYKETMSSS